MGPLEVAGAWPQQGAAGVQGHRPWLGQSPVTAEDAPGNHTHGGSCTLVIWPGTLQGRRLHRSRAGDEGCDVQNGGAHVEYHQLGGRGGVGRTGLRHETSSSWNLLVPTGIPLSSHHGLRLEDGSRPLKGLGTAVCMCSAEAI